MSPKQHYFYKLTPPRPTFAQDMAPSEAKLMQEHVAYWKGALEREQALVFGPVADPEGSYGIAILCTTTEAGAHTLAMNDPAIKANAGFRFDLFAMPRAIEKRQP